MLSKNFIVLRYFWAPIIVATIVSFCFGGTIYGSLERLIVLRENGSDVSAIVVAKHCENHGGIEYEFSANRGHYKLQSFSCFSRCDEVAIGDYLKVRYLEDDPGSAECGNRLEEKIENRLTVMAILSIALVLFVVGCLWKCVMELKKLKVEE